jgi:hypothetical protein
VWSRSASWEYRVDRCRPLTFGAKNPPPPAWVRASAIRTGNSPFASSADAASRSELAEIVPVVLAPDRAIAS